MSGEYYEAFGGDWALIGFLSIVVPVIVYYALKPSRTRRARGRGGPDIDAGIDLQVLRGRS
ncbi:MAG: hypothetical protein KF878_36680 [Planctomycetes bacterium]|nr:hypothetical protein [Planctomycetota bacterium]